MQPENKKNLSHEETLHLLNETLQELKKQQAQQAQSAHFGASPAASPLGGMSSMNMDSIDLVQILLALKKRIVFILLAALLGAVISYGYTTQFVTPKYQASIQMIVNARPETVNSVTQTTVGDITSAQNLVATYAAVIKSNRVMEHVDKTLGLNMGWKRINDMVTVRPVNDTPVINLIVTCTDPELARQIVTAISEFAPEKIVEAVEAGSCRVISDADYSGTPISPNVKNNIYIGFLLGAVLASAVVVFLYMLDDAIYSEDQLSDLSPVPVLSVIPMAESKSGNKKYGYGYGYSSSKNAGKRG